MKYSKYLELVKEQLPSETYICHAAHAAHAAHATLKPWRVTNIQEHDKRLRKYVKSLLKKENAMRRDAGDDCIPAAALNYVIGCPKPNEKVSARIALLDKYIAYHKARGN